ncbi:MAG: diacylglycerol/lipid kinase family protein [Planctomycetota bacterium]|jgi:diacylglycerol kinase family enzyme
MRILILFNPVAGGGRAGRAARRIGACLADAGHETAYVPTRADPGDDWLEPLLADVGALVIVGGDGAVRTAAGPAIRTGTPIYQLPYGTVNLFAREFGMDRRPDTLLRTLARFEPRRVDAGDANGQVFLLMASVGYDAEVVHDVAGGRGSSTSHLSYLIPMLRHLRAWRPSTLAATVDGRPLSAGGVLKPGGLLIVANCRQYMWRLNPARRAQMCDGQLDVLFFPLRSPAGLVGWIFKCAARRQLADPRLVYRMGRTVEIVCDPPQHAQLDGEPLPGGVGARLHRLHLSVRPQVLPVLVPSRG